MPGDMPRRNSRIRRRRGFAVLAWRCGATIRRRGKWSARPLALTLHGCLPEQSGWLRSGGTLSAGVHHDQVGRLLMARCQQSDPPWPNATLAPAGQSSLMRGVNLNMRVLSETLAYSDPIMFFCDAALRAAIPRSGCRVPPSTPLSAPHPGGSSQKDTNRRRHRKPASSRPPRSSERQSGRNSLPRHAGRDRTAYASSSHDIWVRGLLDPHRADLCPTVTPPSPRAPRPRLPAGLPPLPSGWLRPRSQWHPDRRRCALCMS